jgi:hypothetical protein
LRTDTTHTHIRRIRLNNNSTFTTQTTNNTNNTNNTQETKWKLISYTQIK